MTATPTATPPIRTILSGIAPTGRLTLGNYLGALRRFVDLQHEARCLFCVVNLHALTVEHDPARLRLLTREAATVYLAAGLDPGACAVFRQSDVTAHTELAYLMECTASVGELSRMIQFKEKGTDAGRAAGPRTRASLFTYPALMAADILAYRAGEVPVGDDQRQHVELARHLARRFNRTYGEVFVVPRMVDAPVAARVMNLADPGTKMSKSAPETDPGTIRLLDPPEVIRRTVMRAVTDGLGAVRYAPDRRPGVSNLLEILGACTGRTDLDRLAAEFSSYGSLKAEVADAVIAACEPLRKRHADLARDPGHVESVLRDGAARAAGLAGPTVRAAKDALGLGGW